MGVAGLEVIIRVLAMAAVEQLVSECATCLGVVLVYPKHRMTSVPSFLVFCVYYSTNLLSLQIIN